MTTTKSLKKVKEKDDFWKSFWDVFLKFLYFSRIELNAHEGQNEGEIFQTKKAVYQASAERKEDQKAVDAAVLVAAKKVPYMVSYLASNFSLQNGQNPATMKF